MARGPGPGSGVGASPAVVPPRVRPGLAAAPSPAAAVSSELWYAALVARSRL